MQKLIFTVVTLLLFNINTFAQVDSTRLTKKQAFFSSLKKFELDSNDIAKLYAKELKQAFFYKILDKIYDDDSLSKKQSFYALIFSFPEFSNLMPKYKNQKKEVYHKSTKHFREKVNEWTFEKETFENELIMIEEQEREEHIRALENMHEEEGIEQDTLVISLDSTKQVIPITDNINKDNLKKIEERMELEEKKLKEEEKKMLEEEKRLKEERKRMELEEKKKKEIEN